MPGTRARPRKREQAIHGLNLRMSGRLARRARRAEGATAAELDRMVRAWRFGRTLDSLGLLPVAEHGPRELAPAPGARHHAVRRVSRASAARVRTLSWALVVDVLSGRERRMDVPPREVAGLGLDVRVAESELDLDVTMPRGYLDRYHPESRLSVHSGIESE